MGVFGDFSTAKNLTESQIRYAMLNSKSNREAARFLHVSFQTYRKYAKRYRDSETGLTLFEMHKNQAGKNISKSTVLQEGYYRLSDILEGKRPDYNRTKLKRRLIRNNILEEKCQRCGFEERRILDYAVPLLLDWIDGDTTNHRRENLQLLCYNCYFLTVNNVAGKKLYLEF